MKPSGLFALGLLLATGLSGCDSLNEALAYSADALNGQNGQGVPDQDYTQDITSSKCQFRVYYGIVNNQAYVHLQNIGQYAGHVKVLFGYGDPLENDLAPGQWSEMRYRPTNDGVQQVESTCSE